MGWHDIGAASAAYNASQQLGAALGTALLNTIAAGVTASYLTSHGNATPNEATVHGYTTALTVAFGILLAAACITAALTITRTSRGVPEGARVADGGRASSRRAGGVGLVEEPPTDLGRPTNHNARRADPNTGVRTGGPELAAR